MRGPRDVQGYRAHFLYSDASRQTLRSLQRHFGRLFLTVNRCWLIVSYGVSAGAGIVTDIWAALGDGYVVAVGGPVQSNSS